MSIHILNRISSAVTGITVINEHNGISLNMIVKMRQIILLGRYNPIHGVKVHYDALLAELELYEDNYGVIRTSDSKKCVKRMKYRIKAIERERHNQLIGGQNAAMRMIIPSATIEPRLNIHRFKIDDCPCCFEDITNKNIAVLKCNHLLCISCVGRIKNINNLCPICREPLV